MKSWWWIYSGCRKWERDAAETKHTRIPTDRNSHLQQTHRDKRAGRTDQTLIHLHTLSALSHTRARSVGSSMFLWRLPVKAYVLSVCACLVIAYGDDDIEVKYADTFYNEITEDDTSERKC